MISWNSGTAASFLIIGAWATAILLIAGAGCTVTQTAPGAYVVTTQPVESAVACGLQANANNATTILLSTGDLQGAAVAGLASIGAGMFCNGLAVGTPLPAPVAVPASVAAAVPNVIAEGKLIAP